MTTNAGISSNSIPRSLSPHDLYTGDPIRGFTFDPATLDNPISPDHHLPSSSLPPAPAPAAPQPTSRTFQYTFPTSSGEINKPSGHNSSIDVLSSSSCSSSSCSSSSSSCSSASISGVDEMMQEPVGVRGDPPGRISVPVARPRSRVKDGPHLKGNTSLRYNPADRGGIGGGGGVGGGDGGGGVGGGDGGGVGSGDGGGTRDSGSSDIIGGGDNSGGIGTNGGDRGGNILGPRRHRATKAKPRLNMASRSTTAGRHANRAPGRGETGEAHPSTTTTTTTAAKRASNHYASAPNMYANTTAMYSPTEQCSSPNASSSYIQVPSYSEVENDRALAKQRRCRHQLRGGEPMSEGQLLQQRDGLVRVVDNVTTTSTTSTASSSTAVEVNHAKVRGKREGYRGIAPTEVELIHPGSTTFNRVYGQAASDLGSRGQTAATLEQRDPRDSEAGYEVLPDQRRTAGDNFRCLSYDPYAEVSYGPYEELNFDPGQRVTDRYTSFDNNDTSNDIIYDNNNKEIDENNISFENNLKPGVGKRRRRKKPRGEINQGHNTLGGHAKVKRNTSTLQSHKDFITNGVYDAQVTLEKRHQQTEDQLYEQMILERNTLGEEILKQVNEEQSRMTEHLQHWFSDNEISAAERFDKLDELEEYFKEEKRKRISALLRHLSLDEDAAVTRMIDRHSEQLLDIIAEKEGEHLDDFEESDDVAIGDYGEVYEDQEEEEEEKGEGEADDLYSAKGRQDVFSKYDEIALEQHEDEHESFTSLVRDLCKKCTNQVQKLRALFIWIASKDLNDLLLSDCDSNTPLGLLRAVQTGNENYHQLLKRLCSYAGLHVEIIEGYSKGAGYRPGKRFRGPKYRNQWTAVLADGRWRFVNANWGSRHVTCTPSTSDRRGHRGGRKTATGHSVPRPTYACDEFYFLTAPRHHIYQHYPDDPYWQLLESPISLADFESLPMLKSTFFTRRLNLIGPTTAILKTDTNGRVDFSIAIIKTIESNWPKIHTRLITADTKEVIDDRAVLYCPDNKSQICGHLYPPRPGYFYLEIYISSSWQRESDDLAAMFYLHCDTVAAVNTGTKWPPCDRGHVIYGRQVDSSSSAGDVVTLTSCSTSTYSRDGGDNDLGVVEVVHGNEALFTLSLPHVESKLKHHMQRWDQHSEQYVDCERLALPVFRDRHIAEYFIRARTSGFYCFTAYVDTRPKYKVLLRFIEHAVVKVEAMPKATTRWRYVRLVEPLVGHLVKRSRVKFTVLSSRALEVVVGVESMPGQWQHLDFVDRKTGKWSGTILTGKHEGRLTLFCRFTADNDKLIPMLDYTIVKQ